MIDKWYSSKEIKDILKISSQCLYEMKKHNRIEYRKISNKKYLFKLPESFNDDFKDKNIAIYARVSTTKQKIDLDNQIKLLREYAVSNGFKINEKYIFSDIASGINENRVNFNKLIGEIINGNISKVIISNRDRLSRFGYGYFVNIFKKFNVDIIEVNLTNDKTFENELTADLISIIHYFSIKFHGKRKNILSKVEKDIKENND